MDKELRRKGVTLALLWEEHRGVHPDGFGYSWFCEQYGVFRSRLRPSMRQSHAAGEKVFVDFAGDTIDVIDPITGEVLAMKLFVAAMGASSYVFAQARASEKIADWIGAHVGLFAFLGGVPRFVVCDNLKAAVTNPDRYEPGLNRSYVELADHYGVAILPARPRKPRDKAKVEQSVLIVERWILARLRNRQFFSAADLNATIAGLVAVTDKTVEIFHKNERVASHARASHARALGRRGHTTTPEHMPSAHRRHAAWTPARLLTYAEEIGPSTAALFEAIMTERPHPEQGFRTCLGILSLARSYERTRVEAACRRGVSIRALPPCRVEATKTWTRTGGSPRLPFASAKKSLLCRLVGASPSEAHEASTSVNAAALTPVERPEDCGRAF